MKYSMRMFGLVLVAALGLVSLAAAHMVSGNNSDADNPATTESVNHSQCGMNATNGMHGNAGMGMMGSMMGNQMMGNQMMGRQGQTMMGSSHGNGMMSSADFDQLENHLDKMMQMNDLKAIKTELTKQREMLTTMRDNATQTASQQWQCPATRAMAQTSCGMYGANAPTDNSNSATTKQEHQ